ncbi:hypothetical protein QEG98_41005 [Myxococcus sp. MxC21-1]|uniref:hypothetical protein n=1 Tax=Myxococcus sp. MxC21-1 TaxID=3041439 RepID=UPI00292F01B6|nr:hypothetical protein [Myxococcus sp. MxC21-1]WNZ62127.1 hypothetical protein QEG98_41005 [Myxococcus sp. MxC21-1]
MLNPHDRRDLASLGLMVLVYGLVVAPVLHAVVEHGDGGHHHSHAHSHPHGRAHAHGAGNEHAHRGDEGAGEPAPDGERKSEHEHLTGSVEHLQAVALTWAVMKLPRVREVSWLAELQRGPTRVPGSAVRPTAMPQGP